MKFGESAVKHSTSRWQYWLLNTVTFFSVAFVGCRGEPTQESPKTFYLLLVDKSISVTDDQTLYRSTAERILGGVREGDRLLISSITGASGADFRDMREHVLPDSMGKAGWMEEPISFRRREEKHRKSVHDIRVAMRSDVDELMSHQSNSSRTAIFESLRTVAPIFASEKTRRKVLILLSDMVEDSEIADFERRVVTQRFTEEELERQGTAGILPKLQGVSVCVAGALASPPAKSAALERFWLEYFTATGASLETGNYARVMTSCPR